MQIEPVSEEQLFHAARRIDNVGARAEFLNQACGNDQALIARIEGLLRNHDQPHERLDPPEMIATADFRDLTEKPGTQIGPYKLREQIGEGGFGVVYVAEQDEPVRRKVALKIIKPGMDTKDVIARFEAERQALALMDHPNIAKVHDAGATDTGRPYFVMELVHGVSMTEFCDEQKLSTRDRLQLFVDVCRAVQHAHQKGIIHRDLKPSNILITMDGDRRLPKVIDFGVAKALSRKLADNTVYTAYGQMVGTPLYMSPEQAQFSAYDVDTRSDVYSLGVLLYELLTGTTPFNKETLEKSGFDEMRRLIREVDPPRPSARVSTLNAELLSTVSDNRKIHARKLGQSFRSELDWIVMKALEKDRNRRYESASSFAADVERYLNDEPVQACPPSVWYRLRKFARRKKGVLTTASLVVLSLMVGTAVASWQALRAVDAEMVAERDRDRAQDAEAEARENFREAMAAVDAMLTRAAESELKDIPHLLPVRRRLLRKALEFYERFLRENGTNERVRYEAAMAYLRVGATRAQLDEHQAAMTAFSQARELFENLIEEKPGDKKHRNGLADAYRLHGKLLAHLGNRDAAVRAYRRSVEIFEDIATEPDATAADRSALASALSDLASAVQRDEPETAERLSRRSLGIRQRLADEFPENFDFQGHLITAHTRLGNALIARSKLDEAERSLRRAVDLGKQMLKKSRGETAVAASLADAAHHLGVLLWRHRNQPDEAVRVFRGAVELNQQLLDYFPASFRYRRALVNSITNLAGVIGEMDEKHQDSADVEIERLLEKAIALIEPVAQKYPKVPAYQSLCAATLNNAATNLRGGHDKHERALQLLERALVYSKRSLTLDPSSQKNRRFLRNHLWNIADFQSQLGRHADAIATAAKLPAVYPGRVDGYCDAIAILTACAARLRKDSKLKQPQRSELLKMYQQRVESFFQSAHRKYPDDPRPWRVYGTYLRDNGKLLAARTKFKEAYTLARKSRGDTDPETVKCLDAFAALLQRMGQPVQYYQTYVEYWQTLAKRFPKSGKYRQKLGISLGPLAVLLGRRGNTAEAEKTFRRCVQVLEDLVKDFPGEPKYRDSLATAYYNLGYQLAYFTPGADRFADALKQFREAIAMWEQLVREHSTARNHCELARSLASCALVRNDMETGSSDTRINQAAGEAVALLDQAIVHQKQARAIDPKNAIYRDLLARHYMAKARVLLNLDRWRESIAAEKESEKLRGVTDSSWFILSFAHANLGESQPARACFDQGVEWHRRHRQPITDELYFRTRDLLGPVVAAKP